MKKILLFGIFIITLALIRSSSSISTVECNPVTNSICFTLDEVEFRGYVSCAEMKVNLDECLDGENDTCGGKYIYVHNDLCCIYDYWCNAPCHLSQDFRY